MSLTSAAVVAVLAFVAPLAARLIRLPVPDIVIQILLGVAVGPYVLGWAAPPALGGAMRWAGSGRRGEELQRQAVGVAE